MTGIMLFLHVEDTTLTAQRDKEEPGMWAVTCFDSFSKTHANASWDDADMALITSLAIDGELGDSEEDHAKAYERAEELLKDWPKECRPIP